MTPVDSRPMTFERRRRAFNGLLLLALLVVPIALGFAGQPFWYDIFTRLVILAIAATSLRLLLGVAGLASFGHAAYVGIGAYAVGIPAYHSVYGGADWIAGSSGWWHLALALGTSALFALVTGAISLRTSGVHFIMITMAFSQMVYYALISMEHYGGDDGLSIDIASQFGVLSFEDPLTLYLVCFACLLVALGVVDRLTEARFGRVLQAAAQNEARSAALGIDPYRHRLVAFTVAGLIAGVAGFLSANFSLFISPSMVEWTRSGELMFMVILGGSAWLFGPVAGAAAFVLLELLLSRYTIYWHLPFGLVLLGVVMFARGGIVGSLSGSPFGSLSSGRRA